MRNSLLSLAMAAVVVASSQTANATILPWPTPPVTSLQYGNFYIYSLNYLENRYEVQTKDKNTKPYVVKSTGNDINSATVIATGENGNPINQNPGFDKQPNTAAAWFAQPE